MSDKRRNPRNLSMFLDILHIGVGILVVICAVLAFLYPEQNKILFPVIFWLAAVLNGVNGWVRIKTDTRGKRSRSGGILLCVVAAALFIIGLVCAISILR